METSAIDISDQELDAVLSPGYGIFTGPTVEWATLRFTPERARWISRELWHPQQTSTLEPDGCLLLRVPYSDERELAMDIMRHMPEVTVLGPPALQARIRAMLLQSLAGVP